MGLVRRGVQRRPVPQRRAVSIHRLHAGARWGARPSANSASPLLQCPAAPQNEGSAKEVVMLWQRPASLAV